MRWVLAVSVLFTALASCVPAPKDVPCSNQGDCKEVDPQYGFCVDNRCVQCLDDAGCGEGNACVSGRCEHRCQDGRQCPAGQICSDGYCAEG